MPNAALMPAPETPPSSGARLVAPDGRALPLRATFVAAEAAGGIARVVLRQSFVNPFTSPLRVTYLLPLPADGAVSGFSFRIAGKRVVGEIERRALARERFEEALVQGRTAAILEQDRSSLFTQEVGNIPPRAEVDVEVEIDQRLRWLEEGMWEWRFPTVAGARYLGGEGRVPDAERAVVDVSERALPARAGLELAIRDAIRGKVESASHPLSVQDADRDTKVSLQGGASLDRDVVVRWPVAAPEVSLGLAVARSASLEDAHALLTIVPPSVKQAPIARDLIFLIDASGSMHGAPLEQAKKIALAMIDTLGPEDRIELISFGNAPERFRKEALAATREGKRAAAAWLRALRAGGGTEMVRAVIEALRPLRADSQRQVVLMTDGYIGMERELVRELVDRLPAGARLHTVGVGSAVNRTLTQWAARAGGGVEVIVGLGEDPERAAARLLARTTAPIVTGVTIEGARAVAPARVPDLYAGSPALVSLAIDPEGGPLVVRGKTARGVYEARVDARALALGEGPQSIVTLFGREHVEDLETEVASRGAAPELDARIEAIGLAYRISTRMTSWVAISEEVSVDPDAEKEAVTQPHEVPHGVSIEGLGLRAPQSQALFRLSEEGFAGEAQDLGPPVPAARVRWASPGAPPPAMAAPGAPPMAGAPPPSYGPAPASPAATGAHRALGVPPLSHPEPAPARRGGRARAWLWIVTILLAIILAVVTWLVLTPGPSSEGAPAEPPSGSTAEPAEAPARE